MKFLIAVFLVASPFIYFGDFCQPPLLLFWPKFASLLVYSALPFYLKFEGNAKSARMSRTRFDSVQNLFIRKYVGFNF